MTPILDHNRMLMYLNVTRHQREQEMKRAIQEARVRIVLAYLRKVVGVGLIVMLGTGCATFLVTGPDGQQQCVTNSISWVLIPLAGISHELCQQKGIALFHEKAKGYEPTRGLEPAR